MRLVVKEGSGKRGKVALLIEQLSPKFSSFFFPRKTGKARKTGNISNIWKFNRGQNLKEGKIFWKASHSNFWETQLQNRKYGNTRKCAKKIYQVWKFRKKSPSIKRTAQKFGNLDEKSFDMNGPYDPFFFGPGRFALSQPYCSLDLPSLKSGYPLLFSYNNERIPTAVSCRAAHPTWHHIHHQRLGPSLSTLSVLYDEYSNPKPHPRAWRTSSTTSSSSSAVRVPGYFEGCRRAASDQDRRLLRHGMRGFNRISAELWIEGYIRCNGTS